MEFTLDLCDLTYDEEEEGSTSPSNSSSTQTLKPTKHPFKYGCAFCGKRYTSRSGLLSHKNVVHFQRKPYRCQFCNEHFFTSATRVGHIRRYHPNHEPSDPDPLAGSTTRQEQMEDDPLLTNMDDDYEEEVDQGEEEEEEGQQPTEENVIFIKQENEEEESPVKVIGGKSSVLIGDLSELRKAVLCKREEMENAATCSKNEEEEKKKTVSNSNDHRDTFSCLQCKEAVFQHSADLLQHLKLHDPKSKPNKSNFKMWECHACDRKFQSKAWRNVHCKFHHSGAFANNEPDLKCGRCSKVFEDSNKKNLHASILCKLGRYFCSQCDFQFQSVANYAEHVKSCHGQESQQQGDENLGKSLRCPLCKNNSTLFQSLDDERFVTHFESFHLNRSTSILINCDECGSAFNSFDDFKRHMKCHKDGVNPKFVDLISLMT